MANFGETFFHELERDTTLMALYNDVLYNYSLKVFNIGHPKYPMRDINKEALLRYADLLSKSNASDNSDQHKMWAQEIVALLYDLYPTDPEVQFYTGAILHNIGNYQGQKLVGSTFAGAGIYDRIYSEYRKKLLAIPADPDKSFFLAQRQVYDQLTKKSFSYCAPTSMGKSFIFRMFIKERINAGCQENYAIVIPTKALINEFRNSLTDELRDDLQAHNYKIITAVWEAGLQEDRNFIFVLTPERLLYLLIQMNDIRIDYLFIDEAHKLTAQKERRSPVYFKVIEMLAQRNTPPRMVFASPYIPNPEVYLESIPEDEKDDARSFSTMFSPVAQVKYMITSYDGKIYIHNDREKELVHLATYNRSPNIITLIKHLGANTDGTKKQSIIYCSSRSEAIDVARSIASNQDNYIVHEELQKLVADVKREIHADYFLAEVLPKGVAYHVGYLPTNIRQRIEKLYTERVITTIVCTSTLIEGVNLPAENLFIMSYKRATRRMSEVEFRNMIGRIGRLDYNLFGNVFMFVKEEKYRKHFEHYLQNDIGSQRLAPASTMSTPERRLLVHALTEGQIDFDVPENRKISADQYSLMRQYGIMLVKDVISGRNSPITEAFKKELDETTKKKVHDAFAQKPIQQDDNINISVNQTVRLKQTMSLEDIHYPAIPDDGNVDYYEVLAFLERLCAIYDWEKCERDSLGYCSRSGEHTNLKWYAVILCQWIRGDGLGTIIHSAIKHKQNDQYAMIKEHKNRWVLYDGSLQHKNLVISDILSVVENVILFKLSNYFRRFSETYRQIHGDIKNDWYEFLEYGTTDPIMVWLQQNGYDREASHYIHKRGADYIRFDEGNYRLILEQLQKAEAVGIAEQTERIRFNSPEIFITLK